MIQLRLAQAAEILGSRLTGDDREFTGCSIDSRTIRPGELFFALRGAHFDGHAYIADVSRKGAGGAVVEMLPAAAEMPCIAVANTRLALAQLASNWRSLFTLPVVAVTGSNGKTTVKEMIAAVLSDIAPTISTHGNLNNDLGVPLTLFSMGREHRYAVIELGANHPGEIASLTRLVRPTVAVITQCAPAHLEGFGSVDGVARAKAEIFEGLAADGTAVINRDDPFADMWLASAGGMNNITFGLGEGAQFTATDLQVDERTGDSDFILHSPQRSLPVHLQLPGRHNVINALAAGACCHAMGVSLAQIRDGLQRMTAIKGRLQTRPGIRGSVIIDDTYNANPGSLRAALQVLKSRPGHHWLVLGDMGELGETGEAQHAEAGRLSRDAGVERLFTLGKLSAHAARSFGADSHHHDSLDALLAELSSGIDQGTVVLVKGSRSMAMERVVEAIAGAG